ncbi:MAG: hypothetical protein DHS20C18_52040 [Saprospiraceae bacterium]|nr:MAG: hypothetical protein DHS20C18_52040 [Saprospiraceae bacterium]
MKPVYRILLFFLLTQLLYFSTREAGFVTDYTGLMERFEGQSFLGVFNSFGFPALQPVFNFFLYSFHWAFGVTGIGWYFMYTGMHVLNAELLYRWIQAMQQNFPFKNAVFIGLSASLFFLLSPYQTEALVWRVCFNFLLSTCWIMLSLLFLTHWLSTQKVKFLLWANLVFLLALFSFELALMIPFMGILLVLFGAATNKENPLRKLAILAIPQFILIGLYFLLNRILLGAWVGHYGADVHLRMEVSEILGNFFRFGLKLGAFLRYFDHSTKEMVFAWFDNSWLLYSLVGLFGLLIAWGLMRFQRLQPRLRLLGLSLALFGLSLLPVINLYFNYLFYIENDRYSYLASAFFFTALAIGLSFLPRLLRWGAMLAFCLTSVVLLWQTNQYWAKSTQVYFSLLEDFRWYDEKEVFVLAMPDNYYGANLFRNFSGDGIGLKDALKYIQQKPVDAKFHEIALYNMTDPEDGVHVQTDSIGNLKVEFNHYGSWWWRKGQGATNYETDQYRFINEGHHYRLEWKQKPGNAVMIYQVGGKWAVVRDRVDHPTDNGQ